MPITNQPTRRRARVLVIDDDEHVRRAVRRVLQREDFDLVLCDIEMPRMDGVELWHVLSARQPEVLPRVVFFTAGGRSPATRAFIDLHQPAVVDKPCPIHVLRELAARSVLES